MNKAELVSAIAENSGLSKVDAKKAVDAFVESVTEALKKGDKVALVGFGTFMVSERGERTGVNDFFSPDGCGFTCYGTGSFTSGGGGEDEFVGTGVPVGDVAVAMREMERVGDCGAVLARAFVVVGDFCTAVVVGCPVDFCVLLSPGNNVSSLIIGL